MRIAFSGAACTGKTTTIKAFVDKWQNYRFIQSDYRDLIKKTKKHSKTATSKSQKEILDILCSDLLPYTFSDKVVFDRCPLDNLVYSLWNYEKLKKGFTEDFIKKSVEKVRDSMRNLDIIFLCTRDLMNPLIESNGIRETDIEFINEIDNLFKAILKQFSTPEGSPFFPKGDSPALIDIYGSTEERLAQISLYVTETGDAYDEKNSIVDFNELLAMEGLIKEQKEELNKPKFTL